MMSRGKLMVSMVGQMCENNNAEMSCSSSMVAVVDQTPQKNDQQEPAFSQPEETTEKITVLCSEFTEVPQFNSQNFTIVNNVEFEFLQAPQTINVIPTSANVTDESPITILRLENVSEDLIDISPSVEEVSKKQEYCVNSSPEFCGKGTDTPAENPDEMSDDSERGRKLVPYSDTSASDSDSDMPEKRKKRRKRLQVNRADWFAEKNKLRREKGQSYLGRVKTDNRWTYEVPKEPRKMKERCKCRKNERSSIKCATITEYDRNRLFEHFWKQFTWGEKKVYINNTVTVLSTKRHRDRKEADISRRSQTLIYHLRIDDKNVRVCKTMFLNTLGIGKWSVLNWKNEFRTEKSPSVLRELKKEITKPFANRKEQLNKFLDSLPVMESSAKKYLLPEWSSKNSLYNFYVTNWCKSHNTEPLSRASFTAAFEERNMALFRPKKDECEKCARYKVGTIGEEVYQLHIARKEEARLEKNKDKNEQRFVFTADMQAVLMAPKSQVSTLYYRTKLQVHNMCFYNLINNDGFCFLWNETEGGVNAEEFASIWVYFLEQKFLPSIQNGDNADNIEIVIYSDGCSYQNRNAVMANALLNLAAIRKITIVQKYLEVGHTQMEADSMHSTIERAIRKKVVNVPAEYVKYCRTARRKPKPYDVIYLDHSFFKKFNEVMAYKSIRPGRVKGDSKVTDIRALKYTPAGEIFYKERFSEEWSLLPQKKATITNVQWCELPQLHESKLAIKERKYEDLQQIKQTLPADYHDFYDNLPHA